MAINGGIKFFKRNKTLFEDGVTASVSTGSGTGNFILDRNRFTFWRSVGSSDSTTETIIVSFPAAVTIDRLALNDHNWKEFTIKYDLASVFTDFTSVVGLDGALGGGVAETVYARDNSYYEFDSVITTRLELVIEKTQVVDAEKFLSKLFATEELGTLSGYPVVNDVILSRNSRVTRMLSGKSLIQKSVESHSFNISFSNYPNSLTADLDLVMTLYDSEEDFVIWLCGGRFGTDNFRYTLRGWRLQDFIPVQMAEDLPVNYLNNTYISMVNLNLKLVEHV